MMWLKTISVGSVGSTKVLVVTGLGLLLVTSEERAIVVVGYVSEGFETGYLMYKEVYHLVGSVPPRVGAGKRAKSGVDVVFFFEVISG